MHQDPWESPDSSLPADHKPNSEASDASASAGESSGTPDSGARVPSPLLSWHVLEPIIEIDGEATLIEEHEAGREHPESVTVTASLAQPAHTSHAVLSDQYDDVVVAGMSLRRAVVLPGEAATFDVNVANHGRWPALFEVTVEGWIDEAWTPDLPVRVQLEPGAHQVVTVTIAPPRRSDSRAGEHALVVVVRAARYPGHVTRLAATLVIERFAGLKLGVPQPPEVEVSWFTPVATLRLPVTNQSNYPATIHLQGIDQPRHCDFTFYPAANYTGAAGAYVGDSGDDGMVGAAHIHLQPGQTVGVPVEIRTRQRPLMGILPRMTPFRLVARMETEPPLRRAVEGEIAVAALIGPWQMAIAAVLGIVALFGTGLAGLALLVALRSTHAANAAHAVPPLATVAPAPPVVAFVIQMDQPMPTRVPDGEATAPAIPANETQAIPEPGDALSMVPVVSADQVTAPGEPTPVGQPQLRPIVVTAPAAQGQMSAAQGQAPAAADVPAADNPRPSDHTAMTYGQMFKQVASQYDLDWRLLAAQAYLESGFDSLALSGQGDMGLMQIRPGTWHEWAPTVEVSDPFDAYSNVLVGATYLNYLRDQFNQRGLPDPQWMLVAYNWGPDKLFAHLDAGGTWETLDPARRQYADDVLQIAASIPPS